MRRRTPASEKAIKQLPSHWNLHIPMKVVVGVFHRILKIDTLMRSGCARMQVCVRVCVCVHASVSLSPYAFTSCHGDVRRMCRSRADLEFRVWGAPFGGAGGGGGGENWFICIQSDYRGTQVPDKNSLSKKQSTICNLKGAHATVTPPPLRTPPPPHPCSRTPPPLPPWCLFSSFWDRIWAEEDR